MHVQIGFSGPAGSGVNSSGLRLADLLSDHGYAIRADKEFASVIKGENNCFFLSISDQEEYFLSKKVDFFVAFDDYAITKNQDLYDLQNSINISKISAKHKNTFAFGAMLSILNISLEVGEEYFKKLIKEELRVENLPDLGAGYEYGSNLCENDDKYHTTFMLQKIAEPKEIKYGNQLVAQGAMQSGLSFYSAYPMTPASSIADTILEHPEVTFFQ
ncbi:MAG: hypothetical protein LBI53_06325 [Candidatus Peribacteria bacterium]|jgi:2-oxoglutarate ferredoxin oxidoreductase subunit alpha|nr:hypothetical protein [Candidatus Peribacteria bacterium]